MSHAASSSTPRRSRLALYLDLIRWNRPAGWLVLVWPTLAALWVASANTRARQFYERNGWWIDGAQRQETFGGTAVVEVRCRTTLAD